MSERIVFDPGAVGRLTVIQLYFVGDTLLATPALRALRHRFPSAHIEVVVKRRSLAVLEGNPNLDSLTPYDPPSLWQRPLHAWLQARRWRRAPVDLVVDLTADRRSERLVRALRPRHRIGFFEGERPAGLDAGLPKACGPSHVADHMLALAGLAGATGDSALEFHVPAAAAARAAAWRGRGAKGPVVAVHAGGNSALRRWKLPRFEALVRALVADGCRVWAGGGAGECELGAALAGAGAEDLTGKLTLADLAAHLAASDVLVANDSGPMHFASAVGTPVVSLFGPSLPHTAAPRGPRDIALHVRLECCPCDQKRCVRPDDFCLDRITPAEVLAAVRSRLALGGAAR